MPLLLATAAEAVLVVTTVEVTVVPIRTYTLVFLYWSAEA